MLRICTPCRQPLSSLEATGGWQATKVHSSTSVPGRSPFPTTKPFAEVATMWRTLGNAMAPGLQFADWACTPLKASFKPVQLPTGTKPLAATPESGLEAALQRLDAKKQAWTALPTKERAALLRACLPTTLQAAKPAAEAAAAAKGTYGQGIGEEWATWVPVVTGLREYAESLDAEGQLAPNSIRTVAGGQQAVDVFPGGLENLLFGGWRGEVWLQPGAPSTQGALYRSKAAGEVGPGEVALVLGAGNQLPVVALDILHKLIACDCVVICKMNPVNEYLGPFILRAFKPLVDAGFLEVVYGGTREGVFLCTHPTVRSIHLTGSAATYDAIVWGPGAKKEGQPKLGKEVGAELGCVTPFIICPGGEWSAADMAYHATGIASGLVNNAGHNCVKGEVIVTDAAWPQRQQFLEALRAALRAAPARVAYYPGSEARRTAFAKQFPRAEPLSATNGASNGADPEPWLFQSGLSPEEADAATENWCGVLQEVALPGLDGSPEAFLKAAVDFANTRCWGTLSASMWVHPAVQAQHAAAVEGAIAALHYGTVVINDCPIMGFAVTKLTWGAYPGNTPEDIGSGNCTVHNTMLLDHPQRSVVYAPWKFAPTPFWHMDNRNMESLIPAALTFVAYPSLITLVPPALAALRG